MDVLFAFQVATTTGGDRCVGDMEAVRRWLPRLTMANTKWGLAPKQHSNPGLRLASFMWGRPSYVTYYNKGSKTYYLSPWSFNAGDPFTGDLAQFKTELNWYESVYASVRYLDRYDRVYCRFGLVMAYYMLRAGYNAARYRKRVVLFGTGTPYFRDSYYARYYVNSLRRYSYILVSRTPVIDSRWRRYNVGFSQCRNPLSRIPRNCWYAVQASSGGLQLTQRLVDMCTTSKAAWAKVVVTTTTRSGSCPTYSKQADCDKDESCLWMSNQCRESDCQKYCSKTSCNNQNRCDWNATLGACRKVVCPRSWDETKCKSYKQCTWDQSEDKPFCRVKNCIQHSDQNACNNDPNDCIWDTIMSPAGCREKYCDIKSETTCKANDKCIWDTRGTSAKCREDKCKPINSLSSPTREQRCGKLSSLCMVKKSGSTWTCVEKWCVGYDNIESCTEDPMCKWDADIAPAACVDTFCSRYKGSSVCNAGDSECEWDSALIDTQKKAAGDNANGVCIPKRCFASTTGCSCQTHEQCQWADGSCRYYPYYNVSNLDVYILLDGTQSMSQKMGSWPNGYRGVVTVLKQWVNSLTLTGTTASTSPGNAVGMRMTLWQFGPSSGSTTAPSPWNKVSGNRKELLKMLDWQENNFGNFKGSATYIQTAMDNIVSAVQKTPSNRQNILLIISDSPISDVNKLSTTFTTLAGYNCQSLVVALKADATTSVPTAVQSSLKELASSPSSTHYVELFTNALTPGMLQYVDDFANSANFEPGLTVTSMNMDLTMPCANISAKALCLRNQFCNWRSIDKCKYSTQCPNLGCREPNSNAPNKAYTCSDCYFSTSVKKIYCSFSYNFAVAKQSSGCGNAECTTICSSSSCASSKYGCEWSSSDSLCYRKVCEYSTQTSCDDDTTCAWDYEKKECRLNKCTGLTNVDDCMVQQNGTAQSCKWNGGATQTPKCVENPCPVTNFSMYVEHLCQLLQQRLYPQTLRHLHCCLQVF